MEKSLVISSISVAISIFALGWNFYRDVVLKSRAKGNISITNIYHKNEMFGPFITITIVNLGPSRLHLESIYIAKLSWFRFLGKRIARFLNRESKYGHVMWDYTNEYSSRLPTLLDVGEKASFLLKSNQESFLSVNPTHVGITDSFGRFHWVDSLSLRATKSEYFEKYSKNEWGYSHKQS